MPVWEHGDTQFGTQEEWAFKSRTFPAQIVGVDEENGKLTVQLIGSHEQFVVDVPVHGFSINGLKSAWQRYMPVEGEFIDLAYSPTNQPRVVGVTTFSGTRDDNGAYAEVAAAAKASTKNLDLIFRKLSRGEFDLRSSGGAGYYFTKDGHATISAGTSSIELDRDRSESIGEAGLWVRTGNGVEVRYGDVKRQLPGTAAEASVGTLPGQLTPNPGAAGGKEWKRVLSVLVAPAPTPPLFLEQDEVGDIRDDLGIPVPGDYGATLRARRRLYDVTGAIETVTVVVDALGNTKVTFGELAALGGLELSGAASPLKASFLSVTIEAVTNATLEGTVGVEMKGGATAHVASAGLAASHPMVYGDMLKTAFDSHVHATAFGPTIGPPAPVLIPGVDMSATTTVD